MVTVQPLTSTAKIVAVRSLLGFGEDAKPGLVKLLHDRLETQLYTAVSKDILLAIVDAYPKHLTNGLLELLSPPHLRHLSLRGCTGISATGIAKLINKCPHLQSLDLSRCEQLMLPAFFHLLARISNKLVSVSLEYCQRANDEVVQALLLSQPNLKALNLSECSSITDKVFLLNPDTQLNTDSRSKEEPMRFPCQLTSVDLSGCSSLSSTAIRHLASLCGPTLQHVNIAWTKIDCTALWYLSGYSLATAVDLAIAADRLHPQYTNHEKRTFMPIEGASGMVDPSQDDVNVLQPQLDNPLILVYPKGDADILETSIKGEINDSNLPVDGTVVQGAQIEGVAVLEPLIEGTVAPKPLIDVASVTQHPVEDTLVLEPVIDGAGVCKPTFWDAFALKSPIDGASVTEPPVGGTAVLEQRSTPFVAWGEIDQSKERHYPETLLSHAGHVKAMGIMNSTSSEQSVDSDHKSRTLENDFDVGEVGDDLHGLGPSSTKAVGIQNSTLSKYSVDSDNTSRKLESDLNVEEVGDNLQGLGASHANPMGIMYSTNFEICQLSMSSEPKGPVTKACNIKKMDIMDPTNSETYEHSITRQPMATVTKASNIKAMDIMDSANSELCEHSMTRQPIGTVPKTSQVKLMGIMDSIPSEISEHSMTSGAMAGQPSSEDTQVRSYIEKIIQESYQRLSKTSECHNDQTVHTKQPLREDFDSDRTSPGGGPQDQDVLNPEGGSVGKVHEEVGHFVDSVLQAACLQLSGSLENGGQIKTESELEISLGAGHQATEACGNATNYDNVTVAASSYSNTPIHSSENSYLSTHCKSLASHEMGDRELTQNDAREREPILSLNGDAESQSEGIIGKGELCNHTVESKVAHQIVCEERIPNSSVKGSKEPSICDTKGKVTNSQLLCDSETECKEPNEIASGEREPNMSVNDNMEPKEIASGHREPNILVKGDKESKEKLSGSNAHIMSEKCNREPFLNDSEGNKTKVQKQLYRPDIQSLEIGNMDIHNRGLGTACLKAFFLTNRNVRKLSIGIRSMEDEMLVFIGRQAPHLHKVEVTDIDSLTTEGVAKFGTFCQEVEYLNLQGVNFISDKALVPFIRSGRVRTMNLLETNITDLTLHWLSHNYKPGLTSLDLSWCEAISEDGLNKVATSCGELEELILRHCPASETTVTLLTKNCSALRKLNLSSVSNISNQNLGEIAGRLKSLEELDISWNSTLTEEGVRQILIYLPNLTNLNLAGIKRLTSKPFLPIIANVEQWRRSQALLRFKLQERHVLTKANEDYYSSDEEFSDLYLPNRSTSYLSALRVLCVEYCDKVNDTHLAEIVAVCRGTLRVRDYYGQDIEPAWITCRKGKVFLAAM